MAVHEERTIAFYRIDTEEQRKALMDYQMMDYQMNKLDR